MTDDPTPDPLDDLASAHLDGLTSAAEAARVKSDPELQGRVAALAEARDALRDAPAPVDDARREASIAAALAAFDARSDDGGPGRDELAARRARRTARRRLLPAIGVAAAVAIAALVLPRLAGDDGSTTTTAAAKADRDAVTTTASPMIAAAPGAADSGALDSSTESATGPLPVTTAPPSAAGSAPFPVDLGPVADLDGLVDAARGELAAPHATILPPAPEEGLDACFDAVTATAGPDARVVLRFRAAVRSESALGVVVEHPDGRRTLVAAAVGGCRPLGSADL
jgi:hypothetical protein